MAAIDEAQRQLEMSNFRISGLGDPTTANDATKTDNSTGPANPAAAASAGTSLKAAPADHVHQGVHSLHADGNANIYGDARLVSGSGITLTQSGQDITVATSGGLTNKITWASDCQLANTGNTETLAQEWVINFDDASTGGAVNIQVRISAAVKAAAGTGTFNVRVGATNLGSTTGSTIRAVVTTTNTAFETKTNLGAAFTNPGGAVIVQLTINNDTAATKSTLRGASYSIG
jgi:hypothetical protein